MSETKDPRKRITLEITGQENRIETAYDNEAWKKLSLPKKVSVLLEERLQELEKERENS